MLKLEDNLLAVTRQFPFGVFEDVGGAESAIGTDEAITREQALAAMTKNVARMWHKEDKIGSLAVGKIANLTVMDTDLLHDDIEKVPDAEVVATVVDGEVVYQA